MPARLFLDSGKRKIKMAARLIVSVLFFSCHSWWSLEAAAVKYDQFSHIRPMTTSETQQKAVEQLILRVLPESASKFEVIIDSHLAPSLTSLGPENVDTFKYISNGNKLVISGTSGVAASAGFYHFLKYVCFAHVSWSGNQLKIPHPFPTVAQAVTVTSPYRFRYYQNVCTSSYSFAWWNWSRWEREIDWMAMNGINLPLAFTGQEAIWQRVYLNMGLTQTELDQHFGGPAFLAWARMGNIRGWGGPLFASWHANQLNLQHKILTRLRSLGITPVLPAFAGHVPKGLLRLYPEANVSRLGDWGHFNDTYCCTYLLEPTDPLFKAIGKAFIEELTSEFGTNHIYNTDTFNEMQPRSSDPAYLASASKAVFEGMTSGDPNATWLMQGWLFFHDQSFWQAPQVKALLHGVPLGRMIVLDLFAEVDPVWKRTASFYGQPFIWCMLHNFGGNLGLYGSIQTVTTGPVEALVAAGSTIIGTGIAPEGIEQNDVMYELMNEMGWKKNPINPQEWTKMYSRRRYGATDELTEKSWFLLTRSVYNSTDLHKDHCRSVVVRRPSLKEVQHLWYDQKDVFDAWAAMLNVSLKFGSVGTYRYDLVDVTRQCLQLIANSLYEDLMVAYRNNSLENLGKIFLRFAGLLDDMDALLSSNKQFLLGKWLDSAKALGNNDNERQMYEYNARNQITLWGPSGEHHDYANKMWGGLIKGYYEKRWGIFLCYLNKSLTLHEKFDYNDYVDELLQFETKWTFERSSYPDTPAGDSVALSHQLYDKYMYRGQQHF